MDVSTGDNVNRQMPSDYPNLMVVAFRIAAKGALGDLRNNSFVLST